MGSKAGFPQPVHLLSAASVVILVILPNLKSLWVECLIVPCQLFSSMFGLS